MGGIARVPSGACGPPGWALAQLPDPPVDAAELSGVAEGTGGPERRQLLVGGEAGRSLGTGPRFGFGGPAFGVRQLLAQARDLVLQPADLGLGLVEVVGEDHPLRGEAPAAGLVGDLEVTECLFGL